MSFQLQKLSEYVHFNPEIIEDCEVERVLRADADQIAYLNLIFERQMRIIGMVRDEIVLDGEDEE